MSTKSSVDVFTSYGSCEVSGVPSRWVPGEHLCPVSSEVGWIIVMPHCMECMAAGNIHRLQIVMNAAARLMVTDTGRYEYITPVLPDILHCAASPTADHLQDCCVRFQVHPWYWSWLLQWRLHTVGRHSWTFQCASCWSWWPSRADN